MNLHDELDKLYVTFLPPLPRRRTSAIRFGPHVLPMLEHEYGVGAVHPRVLPQFPLYFVADGVPPVTGHINYLAVASDFEQAILVHCVCQHAGHNMRQLSFHEDVSEAGVDHLLGDVAKRFHESRNKRRLFVLLYLLHTMKLLRLPADLMTEMARPRPRGVGELTCGIGIVAPAGIEIVRYEIDWRVVGPEAA